MSNDTYRGSGRKGPAMIRMHDRRGAECQDRPRRAWEVGMLGKRTDARQDWLPTYRVGIRSAPSAWVFTTTIKYCFCCNCVVRCLWLSLSLSWFHTVSVLQRNCHQERFYGWRGVTRFLLDNAGNNLNNAHCRACTVARYWSETTLRNYVLHWHVTLYKDEENPYK